jgi:hypothetical protein
MGTGSGCGLKLEGPVPTSPSTGWIVMPDESTVRLRKVTVVPGAAGDGESSQSDIWEGARKRDNVALAHPGGAWPRPRYNSRFDDA